MLTWTGDGGSYIDDWSNPSNWIPERSPLDGDTLVFPSSVNSIYSDNNMTGLVLTAIDVTGSNYKINMNVGSITNTGGSQALKVGTVTITGANNYVGLPVGSTLTGDIVEAATSGVDNFLCVGNVNISGAGQALEVSAGNELTIIDDDNGPAFSGTGTLFLEGPGEVYQQQPFTYNTCTTVLVGGSFYLGSTNTSYLAFPPAWGPIILEGGTLGVSPGQHYQSSIELPKVTLEGSKITLENIYLLFNAETTVIGDVALELANADANFAAGIDAIPTSHVTVIAGGPAGSVAAGFIPVSQEDPSAYDVGGIAWVPLADVGLVTAQGQFVTVYPSS